MSADPLPSVRLNVISEAPTPHNNYLFQEFARSTSIEMYLYYIYDAKSVPGRPWHTLSEDIGARAFRSGIGNSLDGEFFRLAFCRRATHEVSLVIGWNHLYMYALIAALALQRKPVLLWADTPDPARRRPWWSIRGIAKRLLIGLINSCPGKVFVTGKAAAQEYLAMGVKSEKIANLPFFIRQPILGPEYESQRERMRRDFGIPPGSLFLLAAGRLIYSKGYDLFVEALARIKDRLQNVCVRIIGSGEESGRLIAQIESLGLSKHVRLLPFQEPQVLDQYMQAADIFVQPARFDPFPTMILQAMSHGRAVVASDAVYSATEYIENGSNGILVTAGNVPALADALARSLDAVRISQLGAAARRTAEEWPVSRGIAIISKGIADTLRVSPASITDRGNEHDHSRNV